MNVSGQLLLNFIIAGIMIGALYALMAMGITFIYSIMKMINWSMGEFYMLGSYAQWALIVFVLGNRFWYLGIVGTAVALFILGLIVQAILIRPMFSTGMERKDEYGTVVTIALALFLRNLMTVLSGPDIRTPGRNLAPLKIGSLGISGDRFAAFVGAVIVIASGLFIDGDTPANFRLACANLYKVDVLPVVGANVYDILNHDTLVLTTSAVEKLEARFNG